MSILNKRFSSKALDWSVCNPKWNVLYRKPGVTGRGLYKLRPECAKMFNLYFHHYSRADQSKVRMYVSNWNSQRTIIENPCSFFFFCVVQAEEAQRKIKRQNGEDSGTTIYTLYYILLTLYIRANNLNTTLRCCKHWRIMSCSRVNECSATLHSETCIAYIYLLKMAAFVNHTKPCHDFGFISINRVALAICDVSSKNWFAFVSYSSASASFASVLSAVC